MKTKAKLTLAISALSAVVLSAGVTSTFAWFTTRATASVTSDLTIKGPSGLAVSVQRVRPTGGLTAEESAATPTTSVSTKSGLELGAVSSYDGQYFVAPKVLKTNTGEDLYDETNGTDFDRITTSWAYSNTHVGFLKYNVAVSADVDSAVQDLKLTVTLTDGTANKYARLAVYQVSAANGRKAEGSPELPSAGDELTPSGYSDVFAENGGSTESRMKYVTTPAIAKTAGAKKSALPNKVKVIDSFTSTSAKAYGYFVVAIWMEGTAAADQNGLGGKTVSATITFDLAAHA